MAERDGGGLPVRHPKTLRTPEAQADFAALRADIAVVVAYGLILPKPVLEAPRDGCLNIHASLLPRWRGAAPIHRAILAGDAETGVCIMGMEEGLDTGPVLLRAATPIGPGCRTCERLTCPQRAAAPIGGRLDLDENRGTFIPYPLRPEPDRAVPGQAPSAD